MLSLPLPKEDPHSFRLHADLPSYSKFYHVEEWLLHVHVRYIIWYTEEPNFSQVFGDDVNVMIMIPLM